MDWIILRTSSRHTMSLASSLAKDGFAVWTPVEHFIKRLPRNVRRPVTQPMFAGYVFARAVHLIDLLDVARTPMRRGPGCRLPAHARFWVLREHGGIPLIADHHFDEVRRIEAKRTPAAKAEKPLPLDAVVKVEGGSFGGMTGTVERSDRGRTLVCFNGRYTVKIPTSLLKLDEAYRQQPRRMRQQTFGDGHAAKPIVIGDLDFGRCQSA